MRRLLARLTFRLRIALADTLAEARVELLVAADERWERFKREHPNAMDRRFEPDYSRRYGGAIVGAAKLSRREGTLDQRRRHGARTRARAA